MANDIDDLQKQVAALHARVDAQRAVFTVIVTAIGDADPNARAEIMTGLASFERGLRRTNERDEVLIELRAVREILEALETNEGPEEGA